MKPFEHKQRFSKKIIILAIVIVVAIGGGLYAYWAPNKKPKPTRDEPNPRTQTLETEGQEVEVPVDVDPKMIKNYELVTENETYKIRRDAATDSYVITLYAIINRPDQYEFYQQQLAQYKQDALNYLKNEGVDITNVEIVYEPEEAKDL